MSNLDDIKRKIRGILAIGSDDSGATEAEAANAIAFARRLMLRHQLTEQDVAQGERTAHEIAADTEYDTVTAYTEGAKMSTWASWLTHAINGLVGTTQCYIGDRGVTKRTEAGTIDFDDNGQEKKACEVVFYGPAEDCRDAKALFEEWSVLIAALARMKFGGALRGEGRSYAEGFATALRSKVNEMKKREREQIESAKGQTIGLLDAATVAHGEDQFTRDKDCSALVVVKSNELMVAKKEQGSKWLREEKGIRLRSGGGGGGGRHHSGAYDAGKADGRKADFSRTVTKKLR